MRIPPAELISLKVAIEVIETLTKPNVVGEDGVVTETHAEALKGHLKALRSLSRRLKKEIR